jgi:regulatory protein
MEEKAQVTSRRRRGPRKLTAQSLENAALHYLERFASSSANLRRVLMRRVARSAEVHGTDRAEGERLVDALVQRYVAAGLIDDRLYATQKAASLSRRGTSRYAIKGKLAQKGVGKDLIDVALDELDDADGASELAAACALARRRRLGPYRPVEERVAQRRKDLATYARAGFSLDVARRVLDAPDPQALEALARGEADA